MKEKLFKSLLPNIENQFRYANFCHLRGNYGEVNVKIQKDYQFTYTGFGEDRKQLWRDTYLEDQSEVYHLGIDIQAPAGSLVTFPYRGIVVYTETDRDDLGWGGRIDILDEKNRYWIFGHLDLYWLLKRRALSPNGHNKLGSVGNYANNGHLFEHLHVQVCDFSKILSGEIDIDSVDGYGSKNELGKWLNPLDFL